MRAVRPASSLPVRRRWPLTGLARAHAAGRDRGWGSAGGCDAARLDVPTGERTLILVTELCTQDDLEPAPAAGRRLSIQEAVQSATGRAGLT